MTLPRRRWAEMTAEDFVADTGGWVCVVPTAAIEQHGPHLPLSTDTDIAEGMVAATIARLPDDLPATFLPVQAIGKSNEHTSYRGTLTLTWETAVKAWLEIATSVARAGVRRIVFVNAHGGNTALLDVVARELRVRLSVLAVHTAWVRFGDPDVLPAEERRFGIHGGLMETAMMLHFRPDLVRMDRAERFASAQELLLEANRFFAIHGPHGFGWQANDLNPAGVVGDAAAATAALGERIVAHQADGFVQLLKEVAATDLSVLK